MSRKAEPTMAERATLLVRLWLPDRPGALGAVASRIGAVGGDVHEVEVVDRGEGRAVDELVVTVPRDCPLDLLSREIDEIDGVDIEEFEPVPRLPLDPRMQAFSAALDLAAAPDRPALARSLAEHARSELRADHVAVVDGPGGEVVARAGDGPAASWLVALCRGKAGPAGPLDGAQPRADDVGRTVVPGSRWTLVTGRSAITLRARERQVLQALADLTGLLLPSTGTR
jgi:hypothetical protein